MTFSTVQREFVVEHYFRTQPLGAADRQIKCTSLICCNEEVNHFFDLNINGDALRRVSTKQVELFISKCF
jgi:hypothetical protein